MKKKTQQTQNLLWFWDLEKKVLVYPHVCIHTHTHTEHEDPSLFLRNLIILVEN